MNERTPDIIEEARRVVTIAQEQGVALRLLGGVAVFLRCPQSAVHPELRRDYKDIDFAAPKRAGRVVREILTAQGYEPDRQFNALHGASRLLFYDREHGRQVDCFLGTFEMCHKLNLEPRLQLPGQTLPPSDLLLLKLQVVELNKKDATDALALLLQYAPVPQDGPETLSTGYISRICGEDWGWYTTLHDNLEAVRRYASEILQEPEDVVRVRERADAVLGNMEAAPKSLGWRLRDKIGRRMAWYELPEEAAEGV